ncbi:MAG: RNA polymerase sigma factor [Planctomycetota bacterium]|jgi:DNA-directed RNA polymerase specialized sigma24 family protein
MRKNHGVPDSSATCWTVIKGAAAGREEDRSAFARRYEPAVRAYLGARWRGSPHAADRDDAVQEVFFECFRGVLERADPARQGGFRALLYGVVRNVALRFEERRAKRREVQASVDERVPAHDASLSDAFDRAWPSRS